MTIASRSLVGIVFAALFALSLVATAQDAIAKSTGVDAIPAVFDQPFPTKNLPRPLGRLGISWE